MGFVGATRRVAWSFSFPSSRLGMQLDAKLQLGNGNVTEDCRFLSQAELCDQAGSQTGAWNQV